MSIKIENVNVFGWKAAIRGSRNPMNSWDKSDSWFNFYSYYQSDGDRDCGIETTVAFNIVGNESEEWTWECPLEGEDWDDMVLGPNDHKLLMNLCKGGTEESKWRRMIHVQMDVTAPLYWWKEFDTYKVGTVSNSCSTMHKIHAKPFELSDFSYEHLMDSDDNENAMLRCEINYDDYEKPLYPIDILGEIIDMLNTCRISFNVTKDKKYWWQLIQLLPSSYNQKRTIDLNYEVLASQYRQRKDHKLDEWRQYCDWIKTLPYSEFITMEE